MNLVIWTDRKTDRYDKFMSKALSDGGLRYSNLRCDDKTHDVSSIPEDTIVLCTGGELFTSLRGDDDTLGHLRGSIWPVENTRGSYMIFTYSPCDTSTDKYGRTHNLFMADLKFMSIWWHDVQKAIRIYKNGYQTLEENFIISPTIEQIKTYINERIDNHDLVAIDLETVGWKDSTRPFLFGIAHNQTDGICVPLLDKNKDLFWGSKQREVEDMLEDLLTHCPQVYQNALFDVKVLRQNGYVFPLKNVEHDTMLLHHVLDSAMPHTLDFITSIYGTTPYWKDTLKQSPTKLIELPLEESSTYNLRDCVVLHQILPPMLEELQNAKLDYIYRSESMAGIPCALEQMDTGVTLSYKAIAEWREYVTKEQRTLEKKLRTIWPLPKSFSLTSRDHLAWLVGNEPMKKFDDLAHMEDYEPSAQQACRCSECNKKYWAGKATFPDICTKCGSQKFFHLDEHKIQSKKNKTNKEGKYTKVYQNLLDLQEIHDIPRFYRGRFKIKISRKTKRLVLDQKARQKLRVDAQNWYNEDSRAKHPQSDTLRKLVEWLETYDEWCRREKQRTTYTQFPTWNDGKMHYNILLHGTETGRPASRDVNILNQPTKKEKLLGKCYVAPMRHTIVSLDYSNLEVRVMAYVCKDEKFIHTVESGNLHDINTKALFGIDENHTLWKSGRAASKIYQFGHIQYGGGREIFEKMALAAPELGLTFEQFEQLTEKYFSTYQTFGEWRRRTEHEALSTRRSYTSFGRVRHLYGHRDSIVRQGYNYPSQGTAADVMNHVQVEALRARDKARLRAKLQVQIYDDLRFVCPDDEVDDLIRVVKPVMERTFKIFGEERSFPVDCEVGKSWGDLSPYKEK